MEVRPEGYQMRKGPPTAIYLSVALVLLFVAVKIVLVVLEKNEPNF